MLIQAVNLYRAIVVISVQRTDGFYFKLLSLMAWGKFVTSFRLRGIFLFHTSVGDKVIDRLKGGVFLFGNEKLMHSYSAIMILGYF